MLIVLDDVLDEAHRQAVVSYFARGGEERKMRWEPGRVEKLDGDNSPMALLLKRAAKFFDLSRMVGSEYWAHYGTRPDWHVDKDEKLYETSGNTAHPLCSIVYYADVDVVGGDFMTETARVKPITNRMLVFAPGLLHGVEPFTGTRLSVAVNPWANKPLGYT
jgi:hypothetical protein